MGGAVENIEEKEIWNRSILSGVVLLSTLLARCVPDAFSILSLSHSFSGILEMIQRSVPPLTSQFEL